MNALGVSILLVLTVLVLTAPRRWALLAVIAGVLYLTEAEAISVFGFNLYAMRLLELAGFTRVVLRREFVFTRLNRIDKAVLLLYAYTTVVFLLRSDVDAAAHIGTAIDAYLSYFTFRGLVIDLEQLRRFLRDLLVLLIPYCILLVIERVTVHNLFVYVGGEHTDWLREGKIRCFGSFQNPSLLGTLGASFLPLYIALVLSKPYRRVAAIGIGLCLLIVWASNSGGPKACVVVVVVGWTLWRMRLHLRWVRRGLVAGIVLLALVMKSPIWYILDRVSGITGGTGWHRSYLLDVAFRNLGKWWLAGMPIAATHSWFPYDIKATGGADITNEFLLFGLTAGLMAMVLLIVLLTLGFKHLGHALAAARAGPTKSRTAEYLFWALGVVLVVHTTNWLGIAYFDQIHVIWFFQLAAIATLTEKYTATAAILGRVESDVADKTATSPPLNAGYSA